MRPHRPQHVPPQQVQRSLEIARAVTATGEALAIGALPGFGCGSTSQQASAGCVIAPIWLLDIQGLN
jgi:hypothetical protein